MTEDDWLDTNDPGTLMQCVVPRTSDRKLHYYGIACCRRIVRLLPHPDSHRGIDALERFVEGQATEDEVVVLAQKVRGAAVRISRATDEREQGWIREAEYVPPTTRDELFNNPADPWIETHILLAMAAHFVDNVVNPIPWERRTANWPHLLRDRSFQSVPLIRDIFGNPFRPVAFDPAWRTSTAVGVARAMYDARDFAAMPILADALQDAGCEDDAILAHCHDPRAVHVRGCWVVDLVLGKS